MWFCKKREGGGVGGGAEGGGGGAAGAGGGAAGSGGVGGGGEGGGAPRATAGRGLGAGGRSGISFSKKYFFNPNCDPKTFCFVDPLVQARAHYAALLETIERFNAKISGDFARLEAAQDKMAEAPSAL